MRCEICELNCEIDGLHHGHCGMYSLRGGEVVPRYRNPISSFTVGRIEEVPILHFYPGSLTLLVGSVSCNFDCSYCVNSHIARVPSENLFRYRMSPQELVNKAKILGCKNVAFSVNEPAVSFPYFIEMSRAAKQAGLYTGCATNGYFTPSAMESLANQIDFINVSLKSIRDSFYQEACHVPSIAPVLRNLKVLHDKRVHVEITTPITPEMDEAEAEEIAKTLGEIDRDIPWHIFWLLPEYKMDNDKHVPVEKLVQMRGIAKKHLNHVYIGNLVGSDWLDTYCSKCNEMVIKRINTLGGGGKVMAYRLQEGKCPSCANEVSIVGESSLAFLNEKADCPATPEGDKRILGLLDVHGYQKTFDFRTGARVGAKSPLLSRVTDIMRSHPYPGDAKTESDSWVTNVALEAVNLYKPDLVMLDYAQASFTAVNCPDKGTEAFNNVFDSVRRFLGETDYIPLVIGCGGFEKVKKIIDLEYLFNSEGSVISTGKYAHLSKRVFEKIYAFPTEKLSDLSQHWRLESKAEFLNSLTQGYTAGFAASLGDYIAVAKPGVIFKGMDSHTRIKDLTSSLTKFAPVYTKLDPPEEIAQVASIVSRAVLEGKKIAFIIVEGAGIADFPFDPISMCRNYDGHFIYQIHQQYITLGTGVPYSQSEYLFPIGRDSWLQDYRSYPFSPRFHRFLKNTIRQQIGDKRSLSVGNRNILTHVCLEADISLECYCMAWHNFGTMAVFHPQALQLNKSYERSQE